MNQIKYLVNAFLLLFLLSLGITLITLIFSEPQPTEPIIVDIQTTSQTTSFNSEGKKIFSANCQTCHSLDKVLTGPALRGVETRGPWTDRKNLIKWVRNPAVTASQFAYTTNLVKEYGQVMPSFTNLTDKEIEAIFDYITKIPIGVSIPMVVR